MDPELLTLLKVAVYAAIGLGGVLVGALVYVWAVASRKVNDINKLIEKDFENF